MAKEKVISLNRDQLEVMMDGLSRVIAYHEEKARVAYKVYEFTRIAADELDREEVAKQDEHRV